MFKKISFYHYKRKNMKIGGKSTFGLLTKGVFTFVLFPIFIVCCNQRETGESVAQDEYQWPSVEELPNVQKLPDPLIMFNGDSVKSMEKWWCDRRPELISLFNHYMYGKPPAAPDNFYFSIDDVNRNFYDGKATRKLVTLHFGPDETPPVSLLLVIPNARIRPAPVFIGLNFAGNHTTMDNPTIPLTQAWVNNRYTGGEDNRAHDDQRGIRKSRWQFEKAIERGYAVATMYAGELSPDTEGRFREGVHRGYFEEGQERPGRHEWHAIAAWAWGLQRGVDYLMQDSDIDNNGIIVIGHSRLGKAAILAGATDERIDIVIPNQAGAGGTSPARANVAIPQANFEGGTREKYAHKEFTVAKNNYWLPPIYKEFNDRVEKFPFDQHSLIALVAPRPLLLTNATDDEWADPRGQFNILVLATPVYHLNRVEGLETTIFPEENQLIGSRLGYFIRPGGHSMTDVEWEIWMEFSDKWLK